MLRGDGVAEVASRSGWQGDSSAITRVGPPAGLSTVSVPPARVTRSARPGARVRREVGATDPVVADLDPQRAAHADRDGRR